MKYGNIIRIRVSRLMEEILEKTLCLFWPFLDIVLKCFTQNGFQLNLGFRFATVFLINKKKILKKFISNFLLGSLLASLMSRNQSALSSNPLKAKVHTFTHGCLSHFS